MTSIFLQGMFELCVPALTRSASARDGKWLHLLQHVKAIALETVKRSQEGRQVLWDSRAVVVNPTDAAVLQALVLLHALPRTLDPSPVETPPVNARVNNRKSTKPLQAARTLGASQDIAKGITRGILAIKQSPSKHAHEPAVKRQRTAPRKQDIRPRPALRHNCYLPSRLQRSSIVEVVRRVNYFSSPQDTLVLRAFSMLHPSMCHENGRKQLHGPPSSASPRATAEMQTLAVANQVCTTVKDGVDVPLEIDVYTAVQDVFHLLAHQDMAVLKALVACFDDTHK